LKSYLYDRWKRKPTEKRVPGDHKTSSAGNIWQMDGLSGTIPLLQKRRKKKQQISIFGWLGIETDTELKKHAAKVPHK
jgi:hypothetical protein